MNYQEKQPRHKFNHRPNQPLDGYVRVSRVGGRDRRDGFISPDVQRRAIKHEAKRLGVEVVVHEPELDRSGGTMDRPVFNEILDRIRDGKSGGIIVYKVDRFARSLEGALKTLGELGEHDAAFVSCLEDVAYVTPQERAMLQMQFVFAELTRGMIGESWATATREAVDRGIHIAKNPPLGYRRRDDRRYEPDEYAEAAVEVFRMRSRGSGWRVIARYLDEAAPRDNGKRWATSSGMPMAEVVNDDLRCGPDRSHWC